MILTGTDIYKTFGNVEVLKGVNMQVAASEVVSIIGKSGAGKSTLLHILGTLIKMDMGEVVIKDQATKSLQGNSLSSFRNQEIGFIFQFHYLLPEFDAVENVCIPAFIAKTGVTEARQKATDLLKYLGLGHRLDHKPNQLSGGEQQRGRGCTSSDQ